MPKDSFNRKVNYMRISVTDRCNLRCIYCMPDTRIELKQQDDMLTFDELKKVVKAAASLGIDKFRITGGEPLLRQGLISFIWAIRRIKGVSEVSMTTNASHLAGCADELKKSGLSRINVSLDSLDENKYKIITRGGRLEEALRGIRAAKKAGFDNIKINMVVVNGMNEDEIEDFVRFGIDEKLCIRFIEYMPFGGRFYWTTDKVFLINDVKKKCGKFGKLERYNIENNGSGPANYFKIKGTECVVGFIGAISDPFCANCNRLRLTSDGYLKGCLHASESLDLKKGLRNGKLPDNLIGMISESIDNKPGGHKLMDEYQNDFMSRIGG